MKIIKTNNTTDCIKCACDEASKYSSLEGPSCVVFSDDQITLSIELKLAEQRGGFFSNISTFRHYISQSKQNIKVLSKEVACMVIRKIITETEGFTCYKNIKNNPNLATTIFDLISQIESANITPERLGEIIEDENYDLPLLLRNKLKDILLIYSKYQQYLKNEEKYDSVGYLNLLPEVIAEDKSLKDKVVILVDFSTMTKQRLEAIKAFEKYAKEVICVVVCDNSKIYTNESLEKLKKAFNPTIIETQSTMIEESKILKDNLYEPRVFSKYFTPFSSDKIVVNEARTKDEEVKLLAENIVNDIKEGKRYQNIAVACGNLESYRLKIKEVFRKYNIPYYMDEPLLVSNHPLYNYIEDYIDIIRKGVDRESVIKFVKNPLFNRDSNVVDKFITYINKNSITRKGFTNEFNDKELDSIRLSIIGISLIAKDNKTVKDYITSIKSMFEMLDITNTLNKASNKLQDFNEMELIDFNNRIYKEIIEFLDSIVDVLGDKVIPLIELKNLIKTGLNAMELENIPFYKDAVFIGECKDIKMKATKCLYAIGINGEIPFVSSDSCILTDSDLARLDSFQLEIEPKIEAVNKRERENVCLTFMSFKEKLVISYSATSDGKGPIISEIIKYICRIFNVQINKNIKLNKYINSDTILNRITELLSLKNNESVVTVDTESVEEEIAEIETAINQLQESNEVCKDLLSKIELLKNCINNKEKIQGVEGLINNNEVSTTMIEKYYKCPYANFVQNLLSVKQDEDGELKVNNLGSIYHDLVEHYVPLMENKVHDKDSSDILVDELLEELFQKPEYSSYSNNNKYTYIRNLITNEAKRVCLYIFENKDKTNFKPWLFEESFSDDPTSKFKAINLNTRQGNFKIKGKVDRIDKATIDGKEYIRIIDYKSGNLHSSDEEFYTGRYLQLYLYMTAFIDENRKAAGGYYFPIRDSFESEGDAEKGLTYRMEGNTLKDQSIIEASDKFFGATENSKLIHVKRNKDDKEGNPSYYYRSKLLNEEEYNGYLNYAVKIAQNGVSEIVEGNIKPSPYKGECAYCEYKGMCSHNSILDGERKEEKVKKEEIVIAGNK